MADAPPTTWNQRGRKTTAVKNPDAARNAAVTDTATARVRKRPSEMIGSAARVSTPMKIARMTAPSAISPTTDASVHAAVDLLVSPTRIGTNAAANSPAPR